MATSKVEVIFEAKDKYSNVAKRVTANIEDQRAKQKKLNEEYNKGIRSAKQYSDQSRKISKVIRDEATAVRNLGGEIKGVEKDLQRLSKVGGKRSSGGFLAAQELGRGIADFNAAGGFQDFSRGAIGAANNAERFVEIMTQQVRASGSLKTAFKGLVGSLVGPGGVILALTLLIQFGPKLYQLFRDWADSAGKAKRAQEELNNEVEDGNITVDEYFAKQQQIYRDRISDIDNEIKSLERRKNAINDNEKAARLDVQILELLSEKEQLIAQDNLLIEGMQNRSKVLLEAQEAASKYRKELEKIRDTEDIPEFASEEGLGAINPYESSTGSFDLQSIFGANPYLDDFTVQENVEVIEDMTDAVEDLESALIQAGSAFAGLSYEDSVALKEKIDANKESFEKFAGSLISGFDAAASSAGNFFQNLGKGLLQAIGSYLIQEGTAAVVSGEVKKYSGWLTGLGIKQQTAGFAAIAAGTALKAGGSAIGAGGGSGGGSAVSSGTTSNRNALGQGAISIGGGGELKTKISGNDLQIWLQNSAYGRRAVTG